MPRTIDDYVAKFKDMYIMTKSKYIQQKADGSGYNTLPYKLHAGVLKAHLQQKKTIGCFGGQDLNKFICFDVDCENAQEMTTRLIDCLDIKYGISTDEMLVSYSGSKGYHVEIFFDKTISVGKLREFYQIVLQDVGATIHEIEFRNTYKQGVKLPLSIHRKTGNRCYFVDADTLEPIEDEYIFDVVKLDGDFFLEQLQMWLGDTARSGNKGLTLETDVGEKYEEVRATANLDLTIDYEARINQMLEQNSLLYPSSRHNSTILLGAYYKELGYEQAESEGFVRELLRNTWHTNRHLLSSENTLDYIESETKRLVNYVYEKDYKLGGKEKKPIRITKADILFILTPDKLLHRRLLFTMLCHSKRYAKKDGTFYMTYKQMGEMGNTDNEGRLVKYVTDLKDEGLLEILRRNEYKEKSHLKHPNMYRMTQTATETDTNFVELETYTADNFGRVTAELLSEKELKELVSAKQFRTTFKEYYTA